MGSIKLFGRILAILLVLGLVVSGVAAYGWSRGNRNDIPCPKVEDCPEETIFAPAED